MDKQAHTNVDEKLKDLEEENELLLLQLHQVQEELEVHFLKCKELEGGASQENANSGKQYHPSNQRST